MADGPTEKEIAERRAYIRKVRSPAHYRVPAGPLDTPEKVNEAISLLQEGGANVLGPTCHIDHIPRNHIVSLRWEFFDRWIAGAWYEQAGGGLSPALHMLTRLEGLTGVDWITVSRSDDNRTPLYWSYYVEASVKYFDGSSRTEKDDVPYDLRDGSPEVKAMKGKTEAAIAEQLVKSRAKGAQRASSFAKERIVRQLLSSKQKYSYDEADMPFVWPTLVYRAPADPELDRLLALKEMGLIGDLYGPGRSRTVIDMPEPRAQAALPAPPIGQGVVQQAGAPRREQVAVERNERPIESGAGEQRAWSRTGQGGSPPADERPPWERGEKAPAEPGPWGEFKLDDLVAYCSAAGWPNPTTLPDDRRTQFLDYLRAGGKAEFDSFIASTSKRTG